VRGFALIPPPAPLPFAQERPFLLFDEINNKKKIGNLISPFFSFQDETQNKREKWWRP
jgi:hypothetical protein